MPRLPVERRDALLLLAILALAALLRLPGIEARGRWDADQGHDMLVLHALVADGDLPLLGPRTSIGTFHHGAVYYYLLAPAALVSDANPVEVTTWIAVIGIAAVAGVWWLARLVGGPLAGHVAGLLAAASPAGIDESTFIWNPNLIPLAAALGLAGAVHAWQTRQPRWWLLAAAGAMVTMQCHILGAVIVPPLLVAWLADLRRSEAPGRRHVARAGLGALAIILAGYLPLLVHELQTSFSETRAILDYVAAGGPSSDTGLAARTVLVALRSIAWPLVGVLTDRPAASLVAVVLAAVLLTLAAVGLPAVSRGAIRWLLGAFAWCAVALAVGAANLATITPGLPNDHYHAFLDPIVLAAVGAGIAGLARAAGGADVSAGIAGLARVAGGAAVPPAVRAVGGPAIVAGSLAVLLGLGVPAWPPAVTGDGGWPLVDDAAARVAGDVSPPPGGGPGGGQAAVVLDGIPEFKSSDALGFPLTYRGIMTLEPDSAAAAVARELVIVCDPLFDEVVGARCGGPAEDDRLAAETRSWLLVDRFAAGPRRVVSVYRQAEEP